ncbi:hypothetical protein H634G_05138 [Metarhizium anisopliae BRIP 53293]|uniref:Uncharacterized protein n=1 Tax=Metarhizium anisopliae BRIP 53293 TaxID=1291518 RepID=A0A0D9P0E7_METAN|nr:hypothetical protein H634G_05138 [Metarhizium anisopliae BRIP 53293]KJK88637.1 hypothetical protein H633G_07532 [Metarhizium anisopliae BRIP 53284]
MRLPHPPLPRTSTSHIVTEPTGQLRRRDLNTKNLTFIIVFVVIALFAFIAVLLVAFFRARRRRPDDQDAGSGGRWPVFHVFRRKRVGHRRYEQTSGENFDGEAQIHQLEPTTVSANHVNTLQQDSRQSGSRAIRANRTGASVDRNTSVRSVMTLPAYRATAGNNEQVLGREGDRDGVDVIVDLPTAEEEESLREEEMEAIYQIRIARREQIAQRDELRRQRRDARQRGDNNTLADARARSRAASNNSNLDELRQEVSRIQDQRQRSVSSVSYADLGVARHDGTRIRASSNESERIGLLSDAASIAISARSEVGSSLGLHRREQSVSSLVSVDSEFIPEPSRTRANSGSTTPGLLSGEPAAGSSPEHVQDDLGVEPNPPPGYEVVSIEDDAREVAGPMTPLNEPPPDYSGPNEHMPQTEQTSTEPAHPSPREGRTPSPLRTARGVGGAPQLPSLRISRLPAIVIQPLNEESRDENVL